MKLSERLLYTKFTATFCTIYHEPPFGGGGERMTKKDRFSRNFSLYYKCIVSVVKIIIKG
jgi:hypothetical protein